MMTEMVEFDRNRREDIDLIYSGGTISSVPTEEGAREGGHPFHLTSLMENRSDNADYHLGHEEVRYTGLSENELPVDQANIAGGMYASISRGRNSVTTHGTDTLDAMAEYAEKTVGEMARQAGVKVILTGANEDMYHPNTDVWENLSFALEQAAGDAEPGIYVAYHGRLIPAHEVVKLPFVPGVRPTFVSNKSQEYQEAHEKQQAIVDAQTTALIAAYDKQPSHESVATYDVNVIRTDHQAFLADVVTNPSIKAVLLKLYHSGTANTDKPQQSVAELVSALRDVRDDLVFFAATETGEPVDLHAYVTSVKLRKAGVVPLYNMLHEVALTKLQLLSPKLSPKRRIEAMLKNKVGEIDETLIKRADIKALKELYETTA